MHTEIVASKYVQYRYLLAILQWHYKIKNIQNISIVTFSSLIAYTNYCMAVEVTASSLNVPSYGTVSSIPIILKCLVTNNSGRFLLWSTRTEYK